MRAMTMSGKPTAKIDATRPAARPQKPAPRPAAGPARSKHPAHRDGHGGLVTALVIGFALIGAGLWYWLGGAKPQADPATQLLSQMEAAAKGSGPATHAFGGALNVTRGERGLNITAENVPSRACVQVGWRLAREGTIIVNGTLPMRLSAARLSELCSGDRATLTWVPDQAEPGEQ